MGDYSDHNAYLLAWQLGVTYHVDTNCRSKLRPSSILMWDMGTRATAFTAHSWGREKADTRFTPRYQPPAAFLADALPGGFVYATSANSYNQTGINNLAIVELPMEVNFKLGSLDAKAFGDFSINLEGDDRARAAYAAGTAIGGTMLSRRRAIEPVPSHAIGPGCRK